MSDIRHAQLCSIYLAFNQDMIICHSKIGVSLYEEDQLWLSIFFCHLQTTTFIELPQELYFTTTDSTVLTIIHHQGLRAFLTKYHVYPVKHQENIQM